MSFEFPSLVTQFPSSGTITATSFFISLPELVCSFSNSCIRILYFVFSKHFLYTFILLITPYLGDHFTQYM